MISFGLRLKEERIRINLNQAELASELGISKKSQGLYERGVRSPDAIYLCELSKLEVDVTYLITGYRMVTKCIDDLSSVESALVDNYRASTEENKRLLEGVGASFAQQIIDKVKKA